jgi:hypothetical protein
MSEPSPITLLPPPGYPGDLAAPEPSHVACNDDGPRSWGPRVASRDVEDAVLADAEAARAADTQVGDARPSLPPPSDRRARSLGATLARLRRELLRMARELAALREAPGTAESIERAMRLRFHQTRLVARLQAIESSGLLALSARRLVDPVALVRSAALEVKTELERRGARLMLELSGDGALVWLDAEQVIEAIGCLLDDAVCQADAGGTVALHAHVTDTYLTVTVQDDRRRAAWKATDPVLLAAQLLSASDGELRRRSAPGLVEVALIVPICRLHARSLDAA